MKIRICFGILIAAGIISAAAFSGCTPESPPLPARSGDESSVSLSSGTESSDTSSKAESGVKDTENGGSAKKDSESSLDASQKIWDEKKGELIEVSVRFKDEDGYVYYNADEKDILKKLTSALKKLEPGDPEKASGKKVVLFYTADNDSGMLDFEDGSLMGNGEKTALNNYGDLEKIFEEIKKNAPEHKKKYSDYTNKLSYTGNRIKELTCSFEYQKADNKKKLEMAEKHLRQLESEGLVKKGSICVNEDSVTFTYDCGKDGTALGGISVRDFGSETDLVVN